MNKKELLQKLARLESIHDLLISELSMVDSLMRQLGFSDGLRTAKATALEIHQQGYQFEGDDSANS